MSTNLVDVIGSWIAATGATLGAIGQTKQLAGRRFAGQQLWTVGKGVQAAGASLQAVAETEEPIAEVGNWLIGIGAAAVSSVGARELPNELEKEIREAIGLKQRQISDDKTMEEIENKQIAVIGNSLQMIGAYLVAIKRENPKRVIGGIVQSGGALIEAIGVLQDLSSKEDTTAQQLAVLGGWLQSIGTTLQAVGATEDFTDEEMERG
ncbi:MAG: hypothetical protein LRY73_11655 [Bacillus sp. (in: Bacteria)]|nr:hypothetical protein [Bacillus sp. (in: firmicutes)]